MKEIPSEIIAWKNELASNATWCDLIEVNMGAATIYLCNDLQTVTYDNGTGDHDYVPFPFAIAELKEDGSSDLSAAQLAVADLGGVILRMQMDSQAFTGREVVIHRFHRGGKVAFTVIANITGWSHSDPVIHFQLGYENVTNTMFPARTYRRPCQHCYADPGTCAFPASLLAAHPTCDYSLTGKNGCIAHGKHEADASQPVLHPLNFGGFEGTLPP